MKTFQFVCAKNNQRTELIVHYPSIEEAREWLHKQGYTIIEGREISEAKTTKPAFFFEIVLSGEKKTGQIEGEDILKAYIKLRDTLHYDVRRIYDDREAPDAEKDATTRQVERLYGLYLEQHAVEIEQAKRASDLQSKAALKHDELADAPKGDDINASIKREIDRYHALIQRTLDRTTSILSVNREVLTEAQKTMLGTISDTLRQAKNITNADRLKIIGEESLVAIGKIQMALIDANKVERQKAFFFETNQLLRSFGSREKVILPEDDLKERAKKFINSLIDRFTLIQTNPDAIDKKSFAFYQKLSELALYRKRLKIIHRELLTGIFFSATRKKLLLRRRVVLQNIQIIKKRLSKRSFSYTKIIRGLQYYEELFFSVISDLGSIVAYSLLAFGTYFVFARSVEVASPVAITIIQPHTYYLTTLLAAFAFVLGVSRNWLVLVPWLGLIVGLFVFLQVNF